MRRVQPGVILLALAGALTCAADATAATAVTSDRPAAGGAAPRPASPGPITSAQPPMEDVSFSFGKIEWSQGARSATTIVR